MKFTFDQMLSLAGQIATWFTMVIVFLTLREMERQRKSSQKPDLIIPTVELRGFSTKEKNQKLLIPTELSNEVPHGNNEDTLNSKTYPELEIYNIGFGAAKNIQLVWVLDNVEKTVEAIKNYCYLNSIPIVMKFESDSLNVELDGQKVFMPFEYQSTMTQRYHYILPASVKPAPLTSYFPEYLIHILLPVIICLEIAQSEKKNSRRINFFDSLSVELQLKYEDISNTKYVKKYQVGLMSIGYIKPVEKKLIKRLIYAGQLVFREK